MDADEFLDRAEEELKKKEEEDEAELAEEPEEEVIRDSFYSFEQHTDSVLCVSMNPFCVGQVLTGGQDNRAFLLDTNNPEHVIELKGHEDSVCAVCFSFTGEFCATADMNGKIRVWKSDSAKLVCEIQGPEEPEWMMFYSRGNVLLASGNDFSIWMWMIPSGKPLPLLCGHTETVTCATITPSGKKMLVTGSLDNTLKLWQFRTRELIYSFKADENNWHKDGVECIDVYAANSLCVSGSLDGSVKLTNAKTHKILASYAHTSEDEKENCSVEAVCFNQKFNWIASASMNSKVMIYDIDASRVRQELKHNGGVIRMKWHPNMVVLITACIDGCIYLWDGRTGELLKQLSGHTDIILDMDVLVDENKTYICTASDDHTCQVFRVEI